MTVWEKKIVDAFISHYFASPFNPETGEDRKYLRVRSGVLFPGFDTAHPDEKESYLEAAESLERKGLVQISWEKPGRERIKTLSCKNYKMLFKQAGRGFPKTEAEKIKEMLDAKIKALRESPAVLNKESSPAAESLIALLEFYSVNFGPREIGQRLDKKTMEEIIRLMEFSIDPTQLQNLTTRALSILLYRDSKHLEDLLGFYKLPLTGSKKSFSLPNFTFPERSYPDTLIAGKVIFEFNNSETPMVNAGGHILGFPLASAEEIAAIQPLSREKEKKVLTIENKETFYALGSPQKSGANVNISRYDCFLYTGGYPNRATVVLIKALSASGFSFFHAGDLDPDGILILQNILDIAERPITPLRMVSATFDQYQHWGRPLSDPVLRQIERIRKETKAIPGLAELLRRIEKTHLGVEQEIVDYR
jgi:predicted transcriptional regulator